MTLSARIVEDAAPRGGAARLRTLVRRGLLALAGALRSRRRRGDARSDGDAGAPVPAAWPKATADWRDAA